MLLDHNLVYCSKVLQSAVHLPVYLTHQESFSKRSTFDSTIKKVFQNAVHSAGKYLPTYLIQQLFIQYAVIMHLLLPS